MIADPKAAHKVHSPPAAVRTRSSAPCRIHAAAVLSTTSARRTQGAKA
jgi:hypothetical protein